MVKMYLQSYETDPSEKLDAMFTENFSDDIQLASIHIFYQRNHKVNTLKRTNLCMLNLSFPFLSSRDKNEISSSTNSRLENASKISCSA